MRNICVLAVALVAGCSNATSPAPLDSAIVLACHGKLFNAGVDGSEDADYLIRFDPAGRWQQSLHFYNGTEQRFLSPCEENFSQCSATAGTDLITESGVLRGTNDQALLLKQTTINRRTGTMTVTMTDDVLGQRTVFTGQCQKGEPPAKAAQKF